MVHTPSASPSASWRQKNEAAMVCSRRGLVGGHIRYWWTLVVPLWSTCRITASTASALASGRASVNRRPSRWSREIPSWRSIVSFTQMQRSCGSRTTMPIGARVSSDSRTDPFVASAESVPMSVTEMSHRTVPSCPCNIEIRRLMSSLRPSRWRTAVVPDQPFWARHCSTNADIVGASSENGRTSEAERPTTSPAEYPTSCSAACVHATTVPCSSNIATADSEVSYVFS